MQLMIPLIFLGIIATMGLVFFLKILTTNSEHDKTLEDKISRDNQEFNSFH